MDSMLAPLPLQHTLHPMLKNLIESLLCDVEERLGSHGGAEEIKVCLTPTPTV